MNKIRRNDQVMVTAGKDKGRTGKVIKLLKGDKAIVEGVCVVKKHIKPNPYKNTQGGIIEKESPIHVSNLAILNPATGKKDKVGFKYLDAEAEGVKPKKVRYFKSNDELIDIDR